MATDFSNKTCEQLLAYAKGGMNAAVGAGCPNSKAVYENAYKEMMVLGGCGSSLLNNAGALLVYRTALAKADELCHAEAYAPGGAKSSTSTAGRVVTPKATAKPAAAAVAPAPPSSGSGMTWLLVGGLVIAGLVFGGKKRR